VQEQDGRLGPIAALPVEDVEAVDLDRFVLRLRSSRWDAHRFLLGVLRERDDRGASLPERFAALALAC
jgi:hypothetical protein